MTYRIAVGTLDGKTITEHFGQCHQALIIDVSQETGETVEVETRSLVANPSCGAGHDENRIAAKAEALSDCHVILMAKVGGQSEKQLIHRGFTVLSHEGPLDAALTRIKKAYKSRVFS
ncbi:hypothetical protein FACS1894184_05790 [Clostridia bacterium]|nr:hypothetical protein FACS1894184_05790 [Clostridia bacterium]